MKEDIHTHITKGILLQPRQCSCNKLVFSKFS